ncbi:MAG: hypothetical protein A3J53_02590 [Candidatus Harrisonbacteria bacterium RIFCSPHIGHO2_02_FULL_40_20]|nr:MAG: hypothetical protein A3J53_02590 [Candidatus Harrisonbacteria bacterium RIFCSPHIGHO2_02_FULL_40_20]
MKFRYSARTKLGELQVGFVEAASREAAFGLLSGHDLFILKLEAELEKRPFAALLGIFRRVSRKDLMIFTRQFATLLQAEVVLGDSLKILHTQTSNKTLQSVILEVSSDIDAGLSLSQALERHGDIFSEFYINLIRSAEVTGRMDESMSFLADFLEKDMNLVAKIRNALIYPAFILGLFFVVVIILVVAVFPQLRPIFADAQVDLPLVTKLLLDGGALLLDWWWAMVVIFGVCIWVIIDYFRTKEGRAVWNQLIIGLPVLGQVFRKMYIARFAEAARILLKGGIPIAQAIEISGHTLANVVYREVLQEAAEGIRRGESLSQILSKYSSAFPPLVSQMVAVGESTGRLEEMLGRIATFYIREVDTVVDNLVELIQPVVMVIVGVLVGLLFASILIPIYQLAQGF